MVEESFLTNPPKRLKRKSTKKRKAKKRSSVKKRRNPVGEVIVVGRNPKRRKRKSTRRRKRTVSRRRRRNPVAKRRVTRRRTRRNPVARKRTYRRRRRNPVAKRRRSVRRNPAMVGVLNFRKPLTLIVPIGIGIASTIVTRKVPDMLNLEGNIRYLTQLGVGVVGALILKKPFGAQNAMIWGVVSLVNTVGEVLSDKVGGVFSGFGAYVDYESQAYLPEVEGVMGMGDYATEGQYGAFVDEEEDAGSPY